MLTIMVFMHKICMPKLPHTMQKVYKHLKKRRILCKWLQITKIKTPAQAKHNNNNKVFRNSNHEKQQASYLNTQGQYHSICAMGVTSVESSRMINIEILNTYLQTTGLKLLRWKLPEMKEEIKEQAEEIRLSCSSRFSPLLP